MKKIRFYIKQYQESPPDYITYPSMVLVPNSWDDFGYKVTFRVFYYESYSDRTEIGDVKILDKTTEYTELPNKFNRLNQNQCSLGQSLDYYNKLKELFPDTHIQIFDALNDVAINVGLRKNFDTVSAFKNVLLRFTAAEKAYNEARFILSDEEIAGADFNFTYSVHLPGASKPHEVEFDFKRNNNLPFRIIVLIGKNGTGKTQLLGSLINTISGIDQKGSFKPEKPLFSNFIAISYSLFDKFPIPRQTKTFSYKYIGFRNAEDEIIDDERINNKLKYGLRQIKEGKRQEDWFEFVSEAIDIASYGIQIPETISDAFIKKITSDRLTKLSSGQSIILFMLTELIANIRKDSLILFDEPETHLHPTAVAQFMNVFYRILKHYKSYAIISTHSPLVIQDIPSNCVRVFDRQGTFPIIRALPIESFGENISKITNTIFETVGVKELYKEYLDRLAGKNSLEEINQLFEKGLSINAQLYLTAVSNSTDNEKP